MVFNWLGVDRAMGRHRRSMKWNNVGGRRTLSWNAAQVPRRGRSTKNQHTTSERVPMLTTFVWPFSICFFITYFCLRKYVSK